VPRQRLGRELQVREDLLHHLAILDERNHPRSAAAGDAGQHIELEGALEQAGPIDSLRWCQQFAAARARGRVARWESWRRRPSNSADKALKAAAVRLIQTGFARGIGGKGYYVLSGALEDVEAALAAAIEAATAPLLVGTELIAQPHDELEGPVF
jgi:hypothetical protein